MKYPYIGQRYNAIVLFYAAGKGLLIDNALGFDGDSKAGDEVRLYDGTNITQEYLSNTWGVVESKEHAEFIIELCEVNGIEVFNGFDIGITHFAIVKNEVVFTYGKPSVSEHDKQITIPSPPKAKEWTPEIGDEVEYRGAKFKVLMTADKSGHIVVDDNGNYINPHIEDIKKPKSKQDLLIEELQTKLCNNNAVDNYILACDIINGEIEGLSYEL